MAQIGNCWNWSCCLVNSHARIDLHVHKWTEDPPTHKAIVSFCGAGYHEHLDCTTRCKTKWNHYLQICQHNVSKRFALWQQAFCASFHSFLGREGFSRHGNSAPRRHLSQPVDPFLAASGDNVCCQKTNHIGQDEKEGRKPTISVPAPDISKLYYTVEAVMLGWQQVLPVWTCLFYFLFFPAGDDWQHSPPTFHSFSK